MTRLTQLKCPFFEPENRGVWARLWRPLSKPRNYPSFSESNTIAGSRLEIKGFQLAWMGFEQGQNVEYSKKKLNFN